MKRKSGRLRRLRDNSTKVSSALRNSLNSGLEEFEKGNYTSAIEPLSEALALNPMNTDILSALGFSFLQTGKYDECITVLSEVVKLDPSNGEALKFLSKAHFELKEWQRAENVLLKSVNYRPENAESLNDLGVLSHLQGNLEKAYDYFNKSVGVDGSGADTLYNLGLVCLESGRYSEAVEHLKGLKGLLPEDMGVNKLLVRSLLSSGKSSEALEELELIKETGKNDIEFEYLSGKACYGIGKYPLAEEAFRRCLKIEPEYILAKESLATTLLKSGDSSEALSIWESILTLPDRTNKSDFQVTPRLTNWNKIGRFKIIHPPNGDGNGTENKTIEISIVIPLLQEAENLIALNQEICEVMDKIGGRYEIIYIDDGSSDNTYEILKELKKERSQLKIVRFRKNYGQTAALSAGFKYAIGDVIVTLDGDLQNDPADISKLIEKLAEGYDMVSGWRADRKDNFITRKIPSYFANKIIGKITGTQLNDYGCALKAYKKGVVKNIRLYGEMHRFIPAIVSWLGADIAEIRVNHRPRIKGHSKYNLTRTWRVILDLINVKFLLSYLTRPLQYFGKIGLLFIGASIVVGIGALITNLSFGISVPKSEVFSMVVFMSLMGVQFITMGLMAEIVIRTYHESQDKPIYVIKEVLE